MRRARIRERRPAPGLPAPSLAPHSRRRLSSSAVPAAPRRRRRRRCWRREAVRRSVVGDLATFLLVIVAVFGSFGVAATALYLEVGRRVHIQYYSGVAATHDRALSRGLVEVGVGGEEAISKLAGDRSPVSNLPPSLVKISFPPSVPLLLRPSLVHISRARSPPSRPPPFHLCPRHVRSRAKLTPGNLSSQYTNGDQFRTMLNYIVHDYAWSLLPDVEPVPASVDARCAARFVLPCAALFVFTCTRPAVGVVCSHWAASRRNPLGGQ